MRVKVVLNTDEDIERFTGLVQTVPCDVRLTGKDEHGKDWNISAKSLLCSLVLAASKQKNREHTAHEVDWNTLWCECEEDIYNLIRDYVR